MVVFDASEIMWGDATAIKMAPIWRKSGLLFGAAAAADAAPQRQCSPSTIHPQEQTTTVEACAEKTYFIHNESELHSRSAGHCNGCCYRSDPVRSLQFQSAEPADSFFFFFPYRLLHFPTSIERDSKR